MNILPDDLIILLLKKIEIVDWGCEKDISYLGNPLKCWGCFGSEIKCIHMHSREYHATINLMLVSKRWNKLIRKLLPTVYHLKQLY